MNRRLLQAGRSAIPSEPEAMLAATTGRKLIDILSSNAELGLGTRIAQRFAAIGGIDLDIPARSMARPAPIFTVDAS